MINKQKLKVYKQKLKVKFLRLDRETYIDCKTMNYIKCDINDLNNNPP